MIRGTIADVTRALETSQVKTWIRVDNCQVWLKSVASPTNRRRLSSTANFTPVDHRSSPSINWDNFDGEAWESNVDHLNTPYIRSESEQRAESNLLAAQERLSNYPNQEPYTFWTTYYATQVTMANSVKQFSKLSGHIHALCCILQTAPPNIKAEFSQNLRSFRTIDRALTEDLDQLRVIRHLCELFNKTPLFAQVQVQMLRVTLDEKSQIALARRHAGDIKKQELMQRQKKESQGEAQIGHSPEITRSAQDTQVSLGPVQSQQARDARIRAIENMFNEHPERWTVEPMRSAIKLTQNLKGCFARMERQQRLVRKLTSMEKWKDIQAIMSTAARNIGETFSLSKEWRALRYYKLQQYPEVLDEQRVRLGKDIWQQLQKTQSKYRRKDTDNEY
jgi:hypothetical protein